MWSSPRAAASCPSPRRTSCCCATATPSGSRQRRRNTWHASSRRRTCGPWPAIRRPWRTCAAFSPRASRCTRARTPSSTPRGAARKTVSKPCTQRCRMPEGGAWRMDQQVRDAQPERVVFDTDPSRYRHWRLSVAPPVATLEMNVDEEGAFRPGYRLKLNSYDLGVDIELHDALQRIRFEHPSVRVVVFTSA